MRIVKVSEVKKKRKEKEFKVKPTHLKVEVIAKRIDFV